MTLSVLSMYNSNIPSDDDFDYCASSYPYNLNNNEYYYNTDTDRETEDLSSTEFHSLNKHHYSKANQFGVLSSDSSDSGYDVYSNQSTYYDNRNPSYTSSTIPNQNHIVKCRQLPCRTFISTGSCPYGDRCVFLHDMSIVSKPVYIRSKVYN